MNPSRIPPTQSRRPLLVILGIGLALGLLLIILLVVGVISPVRLGRDAGALRNSVMKSAARRFDKKIEVNVGSFTLNLARTVLHFVPLDPNVCPALQAVRGAEAGVYQVEPGQRPLDHASMLCAADEAMTRRGWDRVVGVMNPHELVAVYVPGNVHTPRDLKVCLAVMERGQLVVASVRSNLEPLLELVLNHPQWRQQGQMPLQLSAAFK